LGLSFWLFPFILLLSLDYYQRCCSAADAGATAPTAAAATAVNAAAARAVAGCSKMGPAL